MQIGIVGGGWSGCHLALKLVEKGHHVTILERNTDIFEAVSGNFGIRLHKGPHYPRSEKTRERCRLTHCKFCSVYPELVVEHEYAIYGLGATDALGNAPKVGVESFTAVCMEDPTCRLIDLPGSEFKNLLMAADMVEPSIVVGNRLRETFRNYLQLAGVTIICNYEVLKLQETATSNMTLIGVKNKRRVVYEFEKVINASGYNSVLLNSSINDNFPFSMATMYQPCIALVFEDMHPTSEKPFSFIVMDGWFPCIMPYIDEFDSAMKKCPANGYPMRQYILTHGSYTIMASCDNPADAYHVLNSLTDEFVEERIKPLCEAEICRFWPAFKDRFRYQSWKGEVLCKLKTQKEFRGSVTYAGPYGVIHVIPGKISNIFDAEVEALALIKNDPSTIVTSNGYSYMRGGVMDLSSHEITELPSGDGFNTSDLNTFSKLSVQPTAASEVKPKTNEK